MFGFHPRTIHVSKDDAHDTNNNFIMTIYQVLIIGDFGLKWKVNVERFKIIVKNLPKSFENVVLTLKIVAFVVNVISHFVEFKQGVLPNHVDFQSLFIYLCDFPNEDGMPPNSLCPSK
jgi:hypothetical protein